MRRTATGIVFVIAGIWIGLSSAAEQDASQQFAAGMQAYATGDYLTALGYYEEARDAGIQGPAVHYNIASCQFLLGQYEQAEANFELIAERFPQMRTLAESSPTPAPGSGLRSRW